MLNVRFVYADDRTPVEPVAVRETRGRIRFDLCRGLFLPEGVAGLNIATARLLAGGQWFQLWKGDIISMSTPELKESPSGRIRRGPLADETRRPRYR